MPDQARRIFVTGEHGQLALALRRACAARGHAVRLAGRATADLADPAAIAAVVADFRPELVINAAAYTAVDKAEDDAALAFAINRDGAANVARAAATARAPLIHVSTDYVYDGGKPSPYVESDAPAPISVYGATKLAGEQAVAGVSNDHIILRTSWVCSPDGNNFVKTMLRLAGQRDEIAVVDDQWGAPTFAADLAQAILTIGDTLLAMKSRAGLVGTYHATSSGETTWCRFARAIMKGSAEKRGPSCRVRAITTAEYPTRAKRPANSRLDCSKLKDVHGVVLPLWRSSLEPCVKRLIEEARKEVAR
jgi:dTDP-4-dehydrorhamnose reductase